MIYGAIASLQKGGGRPGRGGLAFAKGRGLFPHILQDRRKGDTKALTKGNLRSIFGMQQNRKQGAAKKRDTKAPTLAGLFQGGFAGVDPGKARMMGMLGSPGLVFPGYGGYGNTGNMWQQMMGRGY